MPFANYPDRTVSRFSDVLSKIFKISDLVNKISQIWGLCI